MYVVDTCSHEDGFVLRSGHMQDMERGSSKLPAEVLRVVLVLAQVCNRLGFDYWSGVDEMSLTCWQILVLVYNGSEERKDRKL